MDTFTTSITGKDEAATGFTTATQGCTVVTVGAVVTVGLAPDTSVATGGEVAGWNEAHCV